MKFEYNKEFYESNKDYLKSLEKKESNELWFKDYYFNILKYSKKQNKILEIGCGTGITTSFLHKKRPNIIGVDFSGTFVKKARQKGDFFKVMDATNLKFKDNSFDLICSADLIEHIPSLKKALNEMDRLLKNKGILVIQAPNLLCNVFSINYHKNFKNIIKKVKFFVQDYKKPKLRTIEKCKLDVISGDKDAYNLISPMWVKEFFKNKNYDVKYLDTYSTFFELNFLFKLIIFMLKKIPFINYLGGRMIIVLEKNS